MKARHQGRLNRGNSKVMDWNASPCQVVVNHCLTSIACLSAIIIALCLSMDPIHAEATPSSDAPDIPPEDMPLDPPPDDSRDWGIQIGAAVISQNDIGEILSGGLERAKGDAGGQTYSLNLTWIAQRYEIPCRGRLLRPQFEPYFTLTLVDQNHDSVFPDYNGGVGFRWVDFPWNKWIRTSVFMGIGLSYSSHVYRIDRERHPEEDRSHLKFDWPIQITFALPNWPEHQLVIFNDHQSGGHIFDEGGVNSFGLAYRLEF